MKIGELAKKTGVSVRTLHHYDEIGLLMPSARSESEHRIYDKSDIVRLHQILALKRLNLSLEEIGEIVGKNTVQIQNLLDRNIESLEAELETGKQTLGTLRGARQFLIYKDDVELLELTNTIRDITLSQDYFSDSQLSEMEENERRVGAKEMSEILNNLPRMTADIREALARKLPPSDPKVLTVVKRWLEIAGMLGGDNDTIVTTVKEIVDENPEILARNGLNQEMIDYMREAKKHLKEAN